METIKGKLIDAVYVDKDREIALLIETQNGRCQARINRNQIATFGQRNEIEISVEMDRYVDILKAKCLGKEVKVISDPHLDAKLKDNVILEY